MFDNYNEVNGVLLWGPWVVGAFLIALWIREGIKNMGLNARLEAYHFRESGLVLARDKAESELDKALVEARESSAGHHEAVRQLKAERGNVDRLAESLVQLKEQLRQLTQKPAKKPPVKKVKKPVAKAKRVA